MYTSLELSKKLKDNGCDIWYMGIYKKDEYKTYDILNDICCRYYKEFFGYGLEEIRYSYYNITVEILKLLQQNKIQEAEEYIWEHCKFNPLNK